MKRVFVLIGVVLVVFISGCIAQQSDSIPQGDIASFKDSGNTICKEDGKPVIRLFSTTWCPHCQWIKDTYEVTVKEYVDSGKIVAYHWELDTIDNTLTPGYEGVIPDSEMSIFNQFNPKGSIPTFVFGCRYYRIGNGYESTNDLAAEEADFRAVIETLLE